MLNMKRSLIIEIITITTALFHRHTNITDLSRKKLLTPYFVTCLNSDFYAYIM